MSPETRIFAMGIIVGFLIGFNIAGYLFKKIITELEKEIEDGT